MVSAPDNPAANTIARVEAMLCRMPRRARGPATYSSALSKPERPPGNGSMPGSTIIGTSSQMSSG